MSGFNKELLLKVKAEILAHPEHFDMTNWISIGDKGRAGLVALNCHRDEILSHNCGTAACIAGWAVILSGCRIENSAEHMSDAAANILGITQQDADQLFYTHLWPSKYRDMYNFAAADAEMSQAAADRIDAFIAEMESEVSHA